MNCDIAKLQNDDEFIDLLAAASWFYGSAKAVLGVQLALAVGVALVSSVVLWLEPGAKQWTTFAAVTVALLDAFWLERKQGRLRKLGALAQEKFDRLLFGLPWNDLRAGSSPETEQLHRAAVRYKRSLKSLAHLREWYPAIVGSAPPSSATLICQRAATRWDSAQRRTYAGWLLVLLTALFVMVFSIALAQGLTVASMIMNVYVPVAPAALWCIRDYFRQRDAADALDNLKVHIETVWTESLTGKLDEGNLPSETDRIQDALFDHRSRSPLLFNWIYKLQKAENEEAMKVKATELVTELGHARKETHP